MQPKNDLDLFVNRQSQKVRSAVVTRAVREHLRPVNHVHVQISVQNRLRGVIDRFRKPTAIRAKNGRRAASGAVHNGTLGAAMRRNTLLGN